MNSETNQHRKKELRRLQRGCKKKIIRKTQINATLKSDGDGIKVALIILNSDYTSTNLYSDLQGVTGDGDSMEDMLSCFDEVKIIENTSNFEETVRDFCAYYKNKNIKVKCLHFHYSGHGVDNATVEIDVGSYTMEDGKKFVNGVTPTGDCLVGSDGQLYSVHDLKLELLKCDPERMTITLDCCRNRRGSFVEYVRLRHMRPIDDADMKKIAVIQRTSNLHPASDAHTFTQELYKIYNEENGEIPILQIVSKVNNSWNERNIKQLCKQDIVESGNNWRFYMWPTSCTYNPKAENDKETSMIDEERKDDEMGKKVEDLEKTVDYLVKRMQVLDCEKQSATDRIHTLEKEVLDEARPRKIPRRKNVAP